MRVYNHITELIGNTPLIKLNHVVKDLPCQVYAKVDSFNPGNSIKDRIGVSLIDEAEKQGLLKPGGTIVEGTSGNTGMGLALVGLQRGYKCIFITNDKQSKEKVDILRAFGAEVMVCPTDVEPNDPRSYYSVAKRVSEETPNSFYVNQYFNLANRKAHYETTGPEIWNDTDGKITHLVVGVGTGGTISGTGRYLKEQNPDVNIWAIDTYGSALKTYHEKGYIDEKEVYSYITEGIGEDIIPSNIDFSVIDHFEKVTDRDGALVARDITRLEGIFVGYSCGSALAGLLQMKDKLKPEDVVVVVFHDHGTRYVGKVYNDDWMRENCFLDYDGPTAQSLAEAKMGTELPTISHAASIKEAVGMMREHNISYLVVTDDKHELIGGLTEKHVLHALLEETATMDSQVNEVSGNLFKIVPPDMPAKSILQLLSKEHPTVLYKTGENAFQSITEDDIHAAL